MKKNTVKSYISVYVIGVVVLSSLALFLPQIAFPSDYYWVGNSGSWVDPSNWNPNGVPGTNFDNYDNVYLLSSDAVKRTVYYSPGSSYTALRALTIDSTGKGTMTLTDLGSTGFAIVPVTTSVGVNGTGIVNQSGGAFSSYTNIVLGVNAGSIGVWNLSGGHMNAGGTMAGGHITVGEQGTGILNITGGTINANFVVGNQVGGTGTVNLSGTGVINSEGIFIGKNGTGTGTFNQSGGEVFSFGLSVGSGGTYNQSGGKNSMGQFSSLEGTYNLSGGTLEAHGRNVGSGGTFNYSGGELHALFPFTNDGTTRLSGTGTRTMDGDVVNNGTFKTTHTTAVYTGTFTNNGAYLSHRSTQYFNNLIIGQNGFLVGKKPDQFFIRGDFINSSTMNNDWNTMMAYLGFIEGEDLFHDFFLAGQDLGQTMSAYSNNFAWGTVDMTGNILNLYDGNDIAGGALYLREILGLGITGNLVANIYGVGGLNIYYLDDLKGNEYLHGLIYNLVGGGHLMPIHAPEPATMFFLCSGLIGLVGLRRRFKK